VKYELGFYIPEDDILHSHCREDLRLYILLSDRSAISEKQGKLQQGQKK
jgi:hypothetical protein